MTGELHDPAALRSGEEAGTKWTEGCVGHIVDLDALEKKKDYLIRL